jgi:uncharacterized membrane protein YfcA
VIQAAVGFAGGLFAIPLVVMLGMRLEQAVVVSLFGSFVQSLMGAYRLRSYIDPKITIRPALLRLVTLPLGLYALVHLSTYGEHRIKQFIGLILLVIVLVQWIWRVQPRDQLHPAWEYLALALSGFMAGLCGMGGPPMILWVMAHTWTAAKSRAFLFFVFSAGMIPQGLIYWWKFGSVIYEPALLGAMGIFFTMFGTHWGLKIGHTFSKTRLRSLAYFILILIAASAILST